MTEPRFILTTQSASGQKLYYTGRASVDWVSPVKADAFTYGREGAERKQALFNSRRALTGLTFKAEAA